LAARLWNDMPIRFPEIDLDAYVVMPNHIHGIVVLSDAATIVGAPLVGAHQNGRERAATRAAPTAGTVVGAFKSMFTVEYIQGVKEGRWPRFQGRVWQRNYYEHVIRDETELGRVRRHIDENPLRWAFDDENPEHSQGRPSWVPTLGQDDQYAAPDVAGRVEQGGHKGRPYSSAAHGPSPTATRRP
jgi:REP element-mobilizing transposase RayT